MKMTILLADDHPVVLRGLRSILQAEPDFLVIGETLDGLQVPGQLEQLQPDVLILDIMLSGLNGLEVLGTVPQRSPKTRVVVLSLYKSKAFVAEALKKGALGYVLKDGQDGDIVAAVRAAAAGKRFLSPEIAELAIEGYIAQLHGDQIDPHEKLTLREREVLQLTAEGNSSAEIARRLHISPRTVDNHRSNLQKKLSLKHPTELYRYAVRRGLVLTDETV